MSNEYHYFALDRFEAEVAILISDSGLVAEVPREVLPNGIRTGSILKVQGLEGGGIDWEAAEVDEAERRARLDKAKRTLANLKKRDPGGDVSL